MITWCRVIKSSANDSATCTVERNSEKGEKDIYSWGCPNYYKTLNLSEDHVKTTNICSIALSENYLTKIYDIYFNQSSSNLLVKISLKLF